MTTPLRNVFKQVFAFGRDANNFYEFDNWWNVWSNDPEFIQSLENHLAEYYKNQLNKLKESCK